MNKLFVIALWIVVGSACRAREPVADAPASSSERIASSTAAPTVGPRAEPQGEARACLGLPEMDDEGRCEAPAQGAERGAWSVSGEPLAICSTDPMTGFFRDGRCTTGPTDRGVHVVCATMTEAFLTYTKAQGNDLSTPAPRYGFPGLEPGDRWCLCAARWQEAADAGVAPGVVLEATHARALDIVDEPALRAHASSGGQTASVASPPR